MILLQILLALLLGVSVLAANHNIEEAQVPQALRTFTDRQDKFNGNYNDAMDSPMSVATSYKRPRVSTSPVTMSEPNDNYVNLRNQPSVRTAVRPTETYRRSYYGDNYGHDGVNRNGDPSFYSETSASNYAQSYSGTSSK